MGLAIAHRRARIRVAIRIVHWLQEEVREAKIGITLRLGASLRIDQFQLVTGTKHECGVRFWTDAGPINSRRRWLGAVRLNADLKALCVQRCNRRLVELKQRFAARADDVWSSTARPGLHNRSEERRVGKECRSRW